MQINRENVYQTFQEYTSHYNPTDSKIKLKIDHTYRVAALCERIAKSLKLSADDVDLAWLLGMLHDVGRFEQVKNYGTFSDADSIDHAHYGVQILYDDGRLGDYVKISPDDREYALIQTAIRNHSAYRIEEGLDSQTVLFCHLLRDADKIDILKVNYDVPLEEIYNVTTENLKHAMVSDEVMKQFFEKHAVLRSAKRTSVDHIVGHAALVFELIYPESYKIIQDQGYLSKILNFRSDNPVTEKQFQQLRQCMSEFLKQQEKLNKS
ncbi:MAG: HD domain-containing protein [Clostridiaceae bacterium]|nr:HD domain-containing protein [Clostridiaceae bacterium]